MEKDATITLVTLAYFKKCRDRIVVLSSTWKRKTLN